MEQRITEGLQSKAKQRDMTLDILKGIGIILMVVGHSGAPNPITNYIYLFHMALFFMASGYVWNDRKVCDFKTLVKSIWSRIRGLWIPYVVANGIFTLLNNFFVKINVYPPERILEHKQIVINLIKNMLFAADTTMGGASWFFRTLFFVSIGHMLIRFVVTRIKFGKILFAAVIVITLIGTEYVNITRIEFFMGLQTCFCGYAAYLLGMLLRHIDIKKTIEKYRYLCVVVGFIVLFVLSFFDSIGLGAGNIGSLPFYFLVSLAGFIMIWAMASIVKGRLAEFLAFCGKKSPWIVMLHFLSFKPVAFFYLLLTSNSLEKVSDFPVFVAPGLFIVYSVIGTLIPLVVCLGYNKIVELVKVKVFKI